MSTRNSSPTDWYGNCYRQGFKNLGATPMVGKFDAEELVRYWKDTGAEVVFMNAFFKAYSLYPSKLTVIDPNLKGRDLVREFCNACKKHSIKSAAYVQTQNHWPFMEDRPDWCQTRTDGTLYGEPLPMYKAPVYWQACYNSPYTEKMVALIHETFSSYHFDAAFIDETYTREGICHCPFCKIKFRKKYGIDLPCEDDISDPAYWKAMEFKYDSFRNGIMRCVDAMREENPDLAVIFNNVSGHCHWCSGHGEQLTEDIDYSCTEYVQGTESLDKLGYAHDTVVARTAFHIGFIRGKSGRNRKVHAYNYVVEPGSQSRMDIDLGLELIGAAAFGGVPAIQGEQTVVKELFGYLKECEPYLVDTKPVPYIGILASQRSADTHNFQLGVPPNYYGDLKGAFNSIFDLKLPVEFLSGRSLESGKIEKLSIIVLSDVGFLTRKQVEVLRRFVKNGGGLIATHQSSLIGEDSKPLANFALSDVFGVNAAGEVRRDKSGFVIFDKSSPINKLLEMPKSRHAGEGGWMKGNDWYHENAELIFDPVQPVTVRKGAKVLANYLPLPGGGGESTRKAEYAKSPTLVINSYGKGKCVYMSQRFGETYGRMPFPVWRQVMADAIRDVAAQPPPIEVEAPLCVSAKLWEQPEKKGRWILHFINDLDITGRPAGRGYHGLRTGKTGARPREGIIPVENIKITVRKPGAKSATLPLEGKTLKTRREGDALVIDLDQLGQHSVLMIE